MHSLWAKDTPRTLRLFNETAPQLFSETVPQLDRLTPVALFVRAQLYEKGAR
mgnify:CR=1